MFVVGGYFVGNYSTRYQRTAPERKAVERARIQFEAEQTKKTAEIKSTLPVREPTYLPDFMKKEEENLWNEDKIQIKYTGCLFIYEHPAPLSYHDSNEISPTKKSVNIGKGIIANIFPYGANSTSYVTFEYSGVAFKIFYNRDTGVCEKQPQIPEEELLKIVSSIIQE